MSRSWVVYVLNSAQAELDLRIGAADICSIAFGECLRKALNIWARVTLVWYSKLLPKLIAYIIATAVLILGFEVKLASIALMIMADVINTVLNTLSACWRQLASVASG